MKYFCLTHCMHCVHVYIHQCKSSSIFYQPKSVYFDVLALLSIIKCRSHAWTCIMKLTSEKVLHVYSNAYEHDECIFEIKLWLARKSATLGCSNRWNPDHVPVWKNTDHVWCFESRSIHFSVHFPSIFFLWKQAKRMHKTHKIRGTKKWTINKMRTSCLKSVLGFKIKNKSLN